MSYPRINYVGNKIRFKYDNNIRVFYIVYN